MIVGTDTASIDHPSPPDFEKAKAAGLAFHYARAAYGTWSDPLFRPDVTAARRAGLPVGGYLFMRFPNLDAPAPSVADQVETLIDAYIEAGLYVALAPKSASKPQVIAGLQPGVLPPVIDVEFPGRGLRDTPLSPAQAVTRITEAYDRLRRVFGVCAVYTSQRVWAEDLGNLPAGPLADAPLWVKTPYVWKANNPVKLQDFGPVVAPAPWHGRAWIQQFQGDATGFPGFSGRVDVNRFLPFYDDAAAGRFGGQGEHADPRADWVHARLGGGGIRQFQEARGLEPDGVVGPRTFAELCRVKV